MAREQFLEFNFGAVKVEFDMDQGRFATAMWLTNTEATDHHLTLHFLAQQPPNVTQPTQVLDIVLPAHTNTATNTPIPAGYSINMNWGNPQCTIEWINLN